MTVSDIDGDPFPVNVDDGTVTVVQIDLNAVVILGLPPVFLNVEVTPRTLAGTVGSTHQLLAMATLTDLSLQDVTADIVWTSLDPSKATVTSGGLITIQAPGVTRITGVFIP